jgi:hypothetical protein
MSSSSALNYNIQSTASFIAKLLAIITLLFSALILFLLWGVGWFSVIFLTIYILTSFYLVQSLSLLPFSCSLAETGNIEIKKPTHIAGNIHSRSFYNGWIILLCVEVADKLLVKELQHNKPRKWFIVFYDSVTEEEYHLLARLINSARWS